MKMPEMSPPPLRSEIKTNKETGMLIHWVWYKKPFTMKNATYAGVVWVMGVSNDKRGLTLTK